MTLEPDVATSGGETLSLVIGVHVSECEETLREIKATAEGARNSTDGASELDVTITDGVAPSDYDRCYKPQLNVRKR